MGLKSQKSLLNEPLLEKQSKVGKMLQIIQHQREEALQQQHQKMRIRIDTDGNGHHVPASKPRTKIKPKAEEATTTEKEHVNVVFIGHVDAGKSTIGGQMMYLTGMVDKRTLEKYEKEAKEKNRETWYLSWCM